MEPAAVRVVGELGRGRPAARAARAQGALRTRPAPVPALGTALCARPAARPPKVRGGRPLSGSWGRPRPGGVAWTACRLQRRLLAGRAGPADHEHQQHRHCHWRRPVLWRAPPHPYAGHGARMAARRPCSATACVPGPRRLAWRLAAALRAAAHVAAPLRDARVAGACEAAAQADLCMRWPPASPAWRRACARGCRCTQGVAPRLYSETDASLARWQRGMGALFDWIQSRTPVGEVGDVVGAPSLPARALRAGRAHCLLCSRPRVHRRGGKDGTGRDPSVIPHALSGGLGGAAQSSRWRTSPSAACPPVRRPAGRLPLCKRSLEVNTREGTGAQGAARCRCCQAASEVNRPPLHGQAGLSRAFHGAQAAACGGRARPQSLPTLALPRRSGCLTRCTSPPCCWS